MHMTDYLLHTSDHLSGFRNSNKGFCYPFTDYNQEDIESCHMFWLRESFPELKKKVMLFSPLCCDGTVLA